ncbi:MAG: hypothetical protein U1D99_11515, partial [Candidatus Omnitrophota bacterium]|nr:hypothetical protein [Candidatus Omnitrophota bacterium]
MRRSNPTMQQQFSIKESPLFWPAKLDGGTLWVLDETLIPKQMKYIEVISTAEAVDVIRKMKTRAFGQFLVVLNTFLVEIRRNPRLSQPVLLKKIIRTADALNKSRPTFPFSEVTAVVVAWAKSAFEEGANIRQQLEQNIEGYLQGIRGRRLNRVIQIAEAIRSGDSILTHCNVSGELAMAAAICRLQGKSIRFFATETRPYLQGAKLTVWELRRAGADVTLVA